MEARRRANGSARSILAGKKPEIDGFEGYQSLNVILTAMEAAKQGKTLKIK